MADKRRFEVKLHPKALKEYENLDNSVLEMVNNAIDELEYRADEVGKTLRNNNETKLVGCKEIKLKDAGIRIVYKISNDTVQILRVVYIITINDRDKDKAFKIAHERLAEIKSLPAEKKVQNYQKLKSIIKKK